MPVVSVQSKDRGRPTGGGSEFQFLDQADACACMCSSAPSYSGHFLHKILPLDTIRWVGLNVLIPRKITTATRKRWGGCN
jgi:hypothetical protein